MQTNCDDRKRNPNTHDHQNRGSGTADRNVWILRTCSYTFTSDEA